MDFRVGKIRADFFPGGRAIFSRVPRGERGDPPGATRESDLRRFWAAVFALHFFPPGALLEEVI
jgi:hypothetical protein